MKGSRILLRSTILLVLLVAGLLIFWWWRSADESAATRNTYLTSVLSHGTLERTVSSTGTLAAVETVAVGTEVSGTVERVNADYNDKVTKGQILAKLKPDLFRAAVADAQGGVDQATASRDLALKELERNQPLFAKGYLSAQEFLPFQINLTRTRAALSSAEAGLLRARTNFANATIRSPIAGTVIQRSIDAGQTVAASLNTPTLFVIARDLAKMQIEAAVDETDIGQIRTDQSVRFSVQSYPDRAFSGVVRQIRLQPTTVQNVVTYTVIIAADNAEKLLLPGMTATVDFVVEQVNDALLLPNAALRFRPPAEDSAKNTRVKSGGGPSDRREVYILDPAGGLQPVQVSVGSTDGQQTVVTGGDLSSGMSVVTGIQLDGKKPKASFSLFGAMRGRPRK